MPGIKKPAKVKEPIRLRVKELADGSKSLYLDIYRNGKYYLPRWCKGGDGGYEAWVV